MGLISRNTIFDGLLAFGRNITWEGGTFVTSSRKWIDPGNISPGQKPALYQIEPVEQFEQMTTMAYKRTFDALWLIYTAGDGQQQGAGSPETSRLQADILDAVEVALAPDGPDDLQSLGGLVHHAWISDIVHKVADAGMLIIPLRLLVP